MAVRTELSTRSGTCGSMMVVRAEVMTRNSFEQNANIIASSSSPPAFASLRPPTVTPPLPVARCCAPFSIGGDAMAGGGDLVADFGEMSMVRQL